MTICPTLTLDFGDVGYPGDQRPFRVLLAAQPLERLIADARIGYRVYELALIQRPGDLWAYVRVIPEALPQEVAGRADDVLAAATWRTCSDPTDRSLPFNLFDDFFAYSGDDVVPASEAWLNGIQRGARDRYVDRLLLIVAQTLADLESSDLLVRHELQLARSHRHRRSHHNRAKALQQDALQRPNADRHSEDWYLQLAQLLADPNLASVAYRGKGDWRLLRILCTEQRRRADASSLDADSALRLSTLSDYCGGVYDWGAMVHAYWEGLGHGDVFIEGADDAANSIKDLIEKYGWTPRVVLCSAADFEISGYHRDCGAGWVVFRRLQDAASAAPEPGP